MTDINLGLSAVATGAADVITATYAPAPTLVDKKILWLRAIAANATTTPTFNPNGIGAKVIKKKNLQALAIGDIAGAGAVLNLQYNSTDNSWLLLNPATDSDSQGLPSVLSNDNTTGPNDVVVSDTQVIKSENGQIIIEFLSGVGFKVSTDADTDVTPFLYFDVATNNASFGSGAGIAQVTTALARLYHSAYSKLEAPIVEMASDDGNFYGDVDQATMSFGSKSFVISTSALSILQSAYYQILSDTDEHIVKGSTIHFDFSVVHFPNETASRIIFIDASRNLDTVTIGDLLTFASGALNSKNSTSAQIRSVVIDSTDFINVQVASMMTQNVSGVGAGISNTAGTATRPGIIELDGGTAVAGRAAILTAINSLLGGGGAMTFDCELQVSTLSTVTDEFDVRFGMIDSATGQSSDGVYWEYDRNTSVNWLAVTASATTRTKTDTGIAVAAATYARFRIEYSADGATALFYINEVLVATNTTNMPTSGTFGFGYSIVKSAGVISRTILIDWHYFKNILTASR